MLAAGIHFKKTNELKEHMLAHDLLKKGHRYLKEDGMIWFAAKKKFVFQDVVFKQKELEEVVSQKSFREAAKEILSDEEYALGRFSYDTVGSIAIIEIPEELLKKEKKLAKLLLETDSHISTVLKKGGGHVGEFRLQEMIYLAGENTKETIVHENGCRLKINVEEVYYSIRLGNERHRIMQLVKPNEEILCMFSGAGPYPCVFAKNTLAKHIVGVEINPKGHALAKENLLLNKIPEGLVELYCGDANTIVPTLKGSYDRITMPLPHTGVEFLPAALKKIKPKGTIHYYTFIDLEEKEQEKKRLKELIKQSGKVAKKITPVLCGQHSPRRFRICYDILIESN